jgi:hypothetical protein
VVAADPANERIDDPPMHPDEKAVRPDDSAGAVRRLHRRGLDPARRGLDDSYDAASTTPPARPRPDAPARGTRVCVCACVCVWVFSLSLCVCAVVVAYGGGGAGGGRCGGGRWCAGAVVQRRAVGSWFFFFLFLRKTFADS